MRCCKTVLRLRYASRAEGMRDKSSRCRRGGQQAVVHRWPAKRPCVHHQPPVATATELAMQWPATPAADTPVQADGRAGRHADGHGDTNWCFAAVFIIAAATVLLVCDSCCWCCLYHHHHHHHRLPSSASRSIDHATTRKPSSPVLI